MNEIPPDDLRNTLPQIPSPPHDPQLHEQQLHGESHPPQNGKTTTFAPPPKKSLTPWVSVFPLLLLAGSLWQGDADTSRENSMSMTGNSVQTPIHRNATPAPTPIPQAPQQTSPTYTLFVPNGDGTLRKMIMKNDHFSTSGTWSSAYAAEAAYLTNELLQKSPRSFPKGTQLLERATVEDNVVALNFNRAFANPDFWRGEARTNEAIYSIVNTVSSYGAEMGKPAKVRFLVEGKPIQTLGEVDVSDAIEPMTLVATP